jgi:hypothetical protein
MDRRPDIVAAVGRMTSPDEVRREIQHLPEYLRSGESVQRLAAGVYGIGTGLLAVTDSRVVVLREGRAGQASEGFPFEQLSGLDWAATSAEHATITITDTTRTTEFAEVAPADAAELVGFVRSLLQPPAPPAPPARGTAPGGAPSGGGGGGAAPAPAAGGSIGHRFTAPPVTAPTAAVPPGAVPRRAASVPDGNGAAGAEPGAPARVERWPLAEVPISQLLDAPSEATAAGTAVAGTSVGGAAPASTIPAGTTPTNAVAPGAPPSANAVAPPNVPREPNASREPNAPREPGAPSKPDVQGESNAQGEPDAPVTADPEAGVEVAQSLAAPQDDAAAPARRRRFWQRSREREVDRTPPPAGA